MTEYRFSKRLSLYIVYISIPICLIGIIQMVGMAYIGMKLAYLNASFMRAYSIFAEANEFSQYLVFVFPFILCGLYTRNRTRMFTHWAALILTVACLLFSMSRGGWLGAGISVLVIWAGIKTAEDKLIWHNVHRLNLIFVAMGVLVVIIAFQTSFIKADVLLNRSTSLFSGADTTASIRLEQNLEALELMTEHPFIGVGIGNVGYNLGSNLKDSDSLKLTIATSSNMFADIGAETGIPGLLLFSLFILSIIFVGINGICQYAKIKESKSLILASLASFIGVTVNGLTYSAHQIPFLWLSAAIIVGATYSRITEETYEKKHYIDG